MSKLYWQRPLRQQDKTQAGCKQAVRLAAFRRMGVGSSLRHKRRYRDGRTDVTKKTVLLFGHFSNLRNRRKLPSVARVDFSRGW